MVQLEELQQPYLFKLRQTAGVKQLIKRQWTRQTWSEMGQGWQGCEDELRLSGWSSKPPDSSVSLLGEITERMLH